MKIVPLQVHQSVYNLDISCSPPASPHRFGHYPYYPYLHVRAVVTKAKYCKESSQYHVRASWITASKEFLKWTLAWMCWTLESAASDSSH